MEERRFDVRVPVANKSLLERLARESEETGIGEARLLVLYATNYVKSTEGGALPLVAGAPPVASNGQRGESEPTLQPSLDGKALDTLFGDPD